MYTDLQLREVFHLEFLRWFGRQTKGKCHILKGGVNLRFFFNSLRYSEDMDLDAYDIKVHVLRETVMEILNRPAFQNSLRTFGIERIILPDMSKAKQTPTTQRFKIHLMTPAGEDLFTKIEFSRRGVVKKGIVVQAVSPDILRSYKLSPLLTPHYNIETTVIQKINAIVSRSVIQARDIFDLFILSSQYKNSKPRERHTMESISARALLKAQERLYEVSFEQFRDTVLIYLLPGDQSIYDNSSSWDEIRLKVTDFIEELKKGHD